MTHETNQHNIPYLTTSIKLIVVSFILVKFIPILPALNKQIFLHTFHILARAPAFSHVTATLNGLTTIRSQRAQKLVETEFDVIQDYHTGPYYLFLVSSEAFGFYLDFISNVFLGFVTLQFLCFRSGE